MTHKGTSDYRAAARAAYPLLNDDLHTTRFRVLWKWESSNECIWKMERDLRWRVRRADPRGVRGKRGARERGGPRVADGRRGDREREARRHCRPRKERSRSAKR